MMESGDRRRTTLDWLVANPVMAVRPWRDEVVEQHGFDARHVYVETFWLPVLGPSAVLALRRFADWMDSRPVGVEVDLVDLGASLGLGAGTGRHTVFGIQQLAQSLLELRHARTTQTPPLS